MIRLGTRASALALVQARLVAQLLGEDVEIVEVVTSGDRDRAGIDKEKWVKELEQALLAGDVDLAVHSAKDVPGHLPDGLALLGAPTRADPRDVLCGAASLAALAAGARVGTSSLRRAAQLRAEREDLEIVAIRGNVDTRLRKLADGEVDALVLAAAGLERLGRADAVGASLDEFVPSPGQGVIALEGRIGDPRALAAAQALTDRATWTQLRCERAVVAELGATCATPVGAHATLDGDVLTLEVFAGLPDGSAWVRDRVHGDIDAPETLGRVAAARVLAAGGGELLETAERMAVSTPPNVERVSSEEHTLDVRPSEGEA